MGSILKIGFWHKDRSNQQPLHEEIFFFSYRIKTVEIPDTLMGNLAFEGDIGNGRERIREKSSQTGEYVCNYFYISSLNTNNTKKIISFGATHAKSMGH